MTAESADLETPPVPRQASAAQEQAVRYIIWILSAFAVNLGITCFLTYVVGYNPRIAFLISLIVITTINYFGLRSFVYRATHETHRRQLVKYLATNGFQRSLEYVMFSLFDEYLAPPVYLTVPIVLALSTSMRFFIYRHFVFREAK